EPLPPTARRRDYVWEVFAGRGMPTAAIDWWTTDSQSLVFAAAQGGALRVDATAMRMLLAAIGRGRPSPGADAPPSTPGPSPRLRGEGAASAADEGRHS